MSVDAGDPYAFIETAFDFARHASRHAHKHKKHDPHDPTVEDCAVGLAADVWDEMQQRRFRYGQRWDTAREEALSPRLRQWQKAYGKDTAARAHQIVQRIGREDTTPLILRLEKQRFADDLRAAKIARGKKITILDRISFRLFGMPFWA